MPSIRTDEDGRFVLHLRDYPELKTRPYYVVIIPDSPGFAWGCCYVTMTRYKHGETVHVGQIAVNREVP